MIRSILTAQLAGLLFFAHFAGAKELVHDAEYYR